jgi:hypothetical protein
MITDPIIEELHAVREQIYNESKAKGMDLLDYIKQDAPDGFEYSDLKPSVTSLKKRAVTPVIK